jgi:hypothetical protein
MKSYDVVPRDAQYQRVLVDFLGMTGTSNLA